MKTLVISLLLVGGANATEFYCVAPPINCQNQTVMHSWSWEIEATPPTWGHVIINGHDYGRVAVGAYFSTPNSVVLPDEIFRGKFE